MTVKTEKPLSARPEGEEKKESPFKEFCRRFFRNKQAVIGLVIFVMLVFVAVFADVLVDYDNQVIKQDIVNKRQPPSSEHLMGTDDYGRDILARVIYGTRIAHHRADDGGLRYGGGIVMAPCGLFRREADNVIMRVMDALITSMLLAIAASPAFGCIVNIMIAVGSPVPGYSAWCARRAVGAHKGFVQVAKAVGTAISASSTAAISNALAPVIVQATLGVGEVIITAALSFWGWASPRPCPSGGPCSRRAASSSATCPISSSSRG
ncbi:MAG: ABC transporter permease [Anaerotruncus massiliensis (ex Togo et al. 2019)]